MSAMSQAAPVARGRVTFPHVVRSEWTKLWTLRSTRWSLLAALMAMLAMPLIIAVTQMSRWSQMQPEDRARFDSIDVSVSGFYLAQLAVGVLGVLVISGEYSTGMIRSSLMAVPKRLPVLWAKLVVFCATTFTLATVASFVAFFAVQAIVHQHGKDKSLSDPHALRAVIGAALFLTVLGALSTGLGALVRNTAGGIAAFVGIINVLPGITALLPQSIGNAINPYLPFDAGAAVATSTFDPGPHLSPWGGFAVFCAYAAVAIAAAAVSLRRRDA